MLNADAEERIYQTYTADCLGMLMRFLYKNTDFTLYSALIDINDVPIETKEQVIKKILNKLGDE